MTIHSRNSRWICAGRGATGPTNCGGVLHPAAVRVELFAEGINGGDPFRQPMERGARLCDCAHNYVYSARTPATRNAGDFTPRVLPYHPDALVPLEARQILWQK